MAQIPGDRLASPPEQPESEPGARAVAWTGGDVMLVLLAGLGFGFIVTVALLVGLTASGIDLPNTAQVGLASIAIYLAVLVAGWLFALKRRDATLEDAGFKWVGWGPVVLAIPLFIGLMVLTYLILITVDSFVGGVPTAQEQVVPAGTTLELLDLVWLLLAGAIAAPIAEEFFFRGLVFRYLRARRGLMAATLVSAALFAVLHLTPLLMPALFVFGIVQALMVHRFDSLYPAIVLHALNNSVLLLAVYGTLSAT